MAADLMRTALAQGVSLSVLSDSKFKHNRLSVNLIVPMDAETISANALLPCLMRKGCEGCEDFTQLNRRLDALYGASLVSDVSKSGGNQIVTIGIKTLDDRFALGGEELVREGAELAARIVFSPVIRDGAFPERDFELERQFLIDTIEAQINDKRTYAVMRCRELMGRGDPAALQKYGTAAQARALTAKSAADAYRKLIDRAAVEIVFVGPGDPSQASQVMKRAFAGLERHPGPFIPARIVGRADEVHEVTERFDVAQSKMVLGFRTGVPAGPREQTAMRLMTALYGGTPSSKLFLNVREKLSLCYYCAARYDRISGILMVDCGVEQKNIEAAKSEILAQLEEIRRGNFEDETLENTRLQLKNSLRAVSDTPGSLEDWYLGRIIEGRVVSPEQEIRALEAVTRDEIIEAANQVTLDTVYLLTAKEDADVT